MKERMNKVLRGSLTALLMLVCVVFCTAETGGCGDSSSQPDNVTEKVIDDGKGTRTYETTKEYNTPTGKKIEVDRRTEEYDPKMERWTNPR